VAMARHLPERPPLLRYAPLAGVYWILGILFTIAWCIACAAVPIAGLDWMRHREVAQAFFIVPFLLGPGTLTAICLIARRGVHQLFAMAFAFNMLGWLCGMTILVVRTVPLLPNN
jgi:hypothetical protein